MTNVAIQIVDILTCPKCGADEMHPNGENVLIRAFKVDTGRGWESQCLVCSGFYNTDLIPTPDNHDWDKGWFI